jgi:hypothetical protein
VKFVWVCMHMVGPAAVAPTRYCCKQGLGHIRQGWRELLLALLKNPALLLLLVLLVPLCCCGAQAGLV